MAPGGAASGLLGQLVGRYQLEIVLLARPTAIRQTEYEYLWVLGVVCLETGHAERLLSPQLNTKIVNTFFRLFSRTIPQDEHAVMVWDGRRLSHGQDSSSAAQYHPLATAALLPRAQLDREPVALSHTHPIK